jgi:Fe-S-cluster containining protein
VLWEVDHVATQYNCAKCPGYCCSYPLIALTKRDVERLGKHFGLGFREAKKKFTKPQEKEEFTMRRKKDEHFGYICQFFDTEKRRCTVYQSRPTVCRSFPGTSRCGYYDFLMFERRAQEDDEFVATTWSGPVG